MSSTKKGFIKAGSILAIVASSFVILFSFIFVLAGFSVNEDFVIETYKTEPGYQYVEELDGGYYIEYNESEGSGWVTQTVTDDEIQLIVTVTRVILFTISAFCLGLAVAEMVISIIMLNKLKNNESKKGLIITLLVLSLLVGGIITTSFMIVALCLKDKKPTLENINEIASENKIENQE